MRRNQISSFARNGPFHLNRPVGVRQFSRLLAAEVCGISGSKAGSSVFRGSVKSTGYPLHSAVFPSLPLPESPCAITFQPDSICSLCNKSLTQTRDSSSAVQAFMFITLFVSRMPQHKRKSDTKYKNRNPFFGLTF
jgi:hypothetical protein